MSSHRRYDEPYFRSLPFDQQLARTSLASINAGPDGVESMSKCQCSMKVYEVKGYERFHDDFKLVKPATSKARAKSSPLLALPKKVRQKIYAYAVAYPEPIPIRVHTTTTSPAGRDGIITKHTWFFNPPLLRTCRAVEKDAAPLFYASNDFKAELTDGDTFALTAWLESTDATYLALVPRLIIALKPHSYFDLDALRRGESSGLTSYGLQALSKLLLGKEVSVGKIEMVSEGGVRELANDAYLMRRGAKDVGVLVGTWFSELQKWLDYVEPDLGVSAEQGENGEDGGEGGREKDGDVGLVTEKMRKLSHSVI